MNSEVKESILELKELVFDEISFRRHGSKNDLKPVFELGVAISKRSEEELYRVTLRLTGEKPKEYTTAIALSGYFTFKAEEGTSEADKSDIINRNTIAILMPYLRSELSLLTAQPNTDSVVLPPFNINSMFDE